LSSGSNSSINMIKENEEESFGSNNNNNSSIWKRIFCCICCCRGVNRRNNNNNDDDEGCEDGNCGCYFDESGDNNDNNKNGCEIIKMRSILLIPELNWRSVKNNDSNNNKKPDMLDVSMKIQTMESSSSSSLERPSCLDSEHNNNNNTNNNDNIGGSSSSVGKHHNNRRCTTTTIESDYYYYEGNNNNENRAPSPSPLPSPSSPTRPRGVGNNSENDNNNHDNNNDIIRGDGGGSPTTKTPGRKIMLKRQADGSQKFLILDCNNNNNNVDDDATTTTTGGSDSSSSSIARKRQRREERSPSMGGECAISVEDNVSVRYFVTPWTLWYYVYAGGISLFIFGYAINGLSIFSEISVIISSVVLYPMMFRGKKMEKAAAAADYYCFPIHYISALGMGSSAIFILFAAVILDPQNYDHPNNVDIGTWEFWILSGNLWVGILFPMVASIFLCKCSPIPSVMAMSAKRVLTFGMPSMAMMSIMFLSFYFTAENNQHKRDQLDYFKEWRLFFADNASLFLSNNASAMNNNAMSAYGLMWLWNSNNNITNSMGNLHNNIINNSNIINNNSSKNSGGRIPNFQDFMRVGKGLEEALFEKSNFVVLLSSFMAPFLLWASVVTFIRAAMAGVSDVQSVFSGYVLVFAAKHYILSSASDSSSSSPTLFVAAVAVAVPPCLITLFAETWKRSSFYSGGYPAAATATNNNNNGDCSGGVDYYGGAGDCMIPSADGSFSSRKKKRDFSISV